MDKPRAAVQKAGPGAGGDQQRSGRGSAPPGVGRPEAVERDRPAPG